jgi:hypothetical protein
MVKRDSFDRLILAVIFRIGAHARGVLWYGVNAPRQGKIYPQTVPVDLTGDFT